MFFIIFFLLATNMIFGFNVSVFKKEPQLRSQSQIPTVNEQKSNVDVKKDNDGFKTNSDINSGKAIKLDALSDKYIARYQDGTKNSTEKEFSRLEKNLNQERYNERNSKDERQTHVDNILIYNKERGDLDVDKIVNNNAANTANNTNPNDNKANTGGNTGGDTKPIGGYVDIQLRTADVAVSRDTRYVQPNEIISSAKVGNFYSLFQSLSTTESHLGGVYKNKLSPIFGSTNGSFNADAPYNSVVSESSSGTFASLSCIADDQPSFGLYQVTPVAMKDVGLINSNLTSSTDKNLELRFALSNLDSNNKVTYSKDLLQTMGIELNGNVIKSVSVGAARVLLDDNAIPTSSWNTNSNVLVGKVVNNYADKLMTIATGRTIDDNTTSITSVNNVTKMLTQETMQQISDVQTYILSRIVQNNWNRYIKDQMTSTDYDTLKNKVLNTDMTIEKLATSAYGATSGSSLSGKITAEGIVAVMHISGPMDGYNILSAIVKAINNPGVKYDVTIKSSTVQYSYNETTKTIIVSGSTVNLSENYPSPEHYLMYHAPSNSATQKLTVSDLEGDGTWVRYDGSLMRGKAVVAPSAFVQVDNTSPVNIIKYDSSKNFTLTSSEGSLSNLYLTASDTNSSSYIKPKAGDLSLNYGSGVKIDMTNFNISAAEKSNSDLFLSHFVVRYFVSGLLTDGSVILLSDLIKNPSLVSTSQSLELLYFSGLTGSSAWTATRTQTVNFDFRILNIYSNSGIDISSFILDSSNGGGSTGGIFDLRNATKDLVFGVTAGFKDIYLPKTNFIMYSSGTSQMIHFNENSTAGTSSYISGLGLDIGKISFLHLPSSTKNIVYSNFNSFDTKADQDRYSYTNNISFDIGSTHHIVTTSSVSNYNWDAQQQLDIAGLMVVENIQNVQSGATLDVLQNYTFVNGSAVDDLINISDAANYTKVDLTQGGSDTVNIGNMTHDSVLFIRGIDGNDKIDIPSDAVVTKSLPIDSAAGDYFLEVHSATNNTTARIYIDATSPFDVMQAIK